MSDVLRLEERIAHLMRATDDLSEVIARQDREIAALKLTLQALLQREADRDAADPAPSARPPHW